MADFDDMAKASAPASVNSANGAGATSKGAKRRKVIGRGQTSLSSPLPLVLPSEATVGVASSKPSDSAISAKPATIDKPLDISPAPAAMTPTPSAQVVVSADAKSPSPAAAKPLDGPVDAGSAAKATDAVSEVAPKRGVGRPRKLTASAQVPAASVPAKRLIAKPSLAKPVVAKPHPIEPVAKPVAAKLPRGKASTPPPASPVSAAQAAGKLAASAAAAARPALRATRIINSVSTPSTTPPSGISIKDLTMDMSANFNGFQGAMSEAQAKAQAAFEKSSNMLGEAGDFAKGNVEAMVEASKIFAEGVQEIGSTLVAESRTAFESMTGDIKELAAAKSPTDFLKLQSDLVRKNFDTAVSYSSKSSEHFLKLMSDAFAPLSGRVSLAVEKARQVAPISAPTNIAA
jgi:phasin family protein